MPTTATFSTAHLADAIGKAARLAPTKGAGFDKAAGILIELRHDHAYVRACDVERFYSQRIPLADLKGDPKTWRLSSVILSNLMQNLPMHDGANVSLIDREDSFMRIKAGRMNAKISTLDPQSFPQMPSFDGEGMVEANDFAANVDRVSWAVKKDATSVLAGVYVDGTKIVATDGYSMATMPCKVQIDAPVALPLASLSGLLKQATDFRFRVDDKRVCMYLDDETQATCQLIMKPFPNVDSLTRTEFLGSYKFSKLQFTETLNRIMVLGRKDSEPTLEIFVQADGLIKLLNLDLMTGDGQIRDAIEVTTGYEGELVLQINPTYMLHAVNNCKGDIVTIHFGVPGDDVQRSRKMPVLVADGLGYECWVMPKIKN